MNFAQATAFCKSSDMALPVPRQNNENQILANIGQTWVNVFVNDLLKCDNQFANWRQRLRGFLLKSGNWDIVPSGAKRDCFCVAPQILPKPGCVNIFENEGNNLFKGGKWTVKQNGETIRFKNKEQYSGITFDFIRFMSSNDSSVISSSRISSTGFRVSENACHS